MHLKSIEISGFKSFAKKTVIEFKSPITAIVGPNGSGKSNVAEAASFVLGEQSIKTLRGKRGEDLIWNGSPERERANRASVKAVFDNARKIFNIDFSEVIIERVVNRDGTNDYLLNGSQVRLKDIMELLAHAHMGASGHHIISQGEADRILTASTKERREMIEDALGLKVYQYKRIESERKLEKTFENIAQVESLRREIAPHLRFLKRQVEKVGKAEEVKQNLLILYREYLKREKVLIAHEREEVEAAKKPLIERQENIKKSGEKGRMDEIRGELARKKGDKDKLLREVGRLEGEIEASDKLIERKESEISQRGNVTVNLAELEQLLAEIEREGEIEEIKNKIRNFINGKKRVTSSGMIVEMKTSIEGLKQRKEEAEREIERVEQGMRDLETEEKEIIKLFSMEELTRSQLETVYTNEERLRAAEGDFIREVEEAAVLLGGDITGFMSTNLSKEQIISDGKGGQAERRRDVERLKIRLEELGSAGGEEMMKEYRETSERDTFLAKELGDLQTSSESLKQIIAELKEQLGVEFESGIKKINHAFNDFFSLMFGGGQAKLEIQERKAGNLAEDGEQLEREEVEEGIEINISLPKKRIKGLNMLSGGERALTSIALIFALSQINPPPFIILDETDAALDEANSKKYGDMIERLSKFSQLILITHNRETMSRAGVIYGVTMAAGGISRLLSVAFDEAVAVAK